MAAYIIADVEVLDAKAYEDYRKHVPATLDKHGGRFLARGGRHEVLEGDWQPHRMVILEFPDAATARSWHDSVEYREPKAVRQRASRSRLILVEGV